MPDLGPKIPNSEITPESLQADRRRFLKSSLLFTATAAGVGGGLLTLTHAWRRAAAPPPAADEAPDGSLPARPGPFATSEPRTPL
ncbi:MAG TPA: mononuclear molybdenum enzyme YedY, partial [Thermoanaerobaculia bacterium]